MSARLLIAVLALLAASAVPAPAQRAEAPHAIEAATAEVPLAQLPREARATVVLIHKGGPFPYARDGVAFSNREAQLPREPRGYYHEYTVKTPGERTRGARRIVAGKGGELYYTDDHYAHFRRIRE
jgi:ribonuclease T1